LLSLYSRCLKAVEGKGEDEASPESEAEAVK
jgi:hypothetical protein